MTVGLSASGCAKGRDARPPVGQPEAMAGNARIFAKARSKRCCQGQCSGPRSTGVPARLTKRPGTAMSCERSVAATVSWSSGWTWPTRAVQRHRLWASTAQANQAPLAAKFPDGQ